METKQTKKTPKKVSYIWKFFEDIPENDYIKKCNLCGDLVSFSEKHPYDHLYNFIITGPYLESHYHQVIAISNWAEYNNHDFLFIDSKNINRGHVQHMAVHLYSKHPDQYAEYLKKRHKRCSYLTHDPSIYVKAEDIVKTMRFIVMNNVELEKLFNKEGKMYFGNILNQRNFGIILDYMFELYIQNIQKETASSIPITICIDEWTATHSDMRVLGISAHYITPSLNIKRKVIGIKLLKSGDAVTIRNTTLQTKNDFFDPNYDVVVVHDTPNVMNAAFGVSINVENYSQMEDEEDVESSTKGNNEFMPLTDEILFESLKCQKKFEKSKNVVVRNQSCGMHVYDLVSKKSVNQSPSVYEQFEKRHKIIVELKKDNNWKEFVVFCEIKGVDVNKFIMLSNTRFYVYIDQYIQFENKKEIIIEFFKLKGYRIVDSTENYEKKSPKEKIIEIPEELEDSTKVLKEIKKSQLIISHETNETLPHLVETVLSVVKLIHEGLEKHGVEISNVRKIIPLSRITEGNRIQFKKKILQNGRWVKRNFELVIFPNGYIIEQNTTTEQKFSNDCLLLLFLMYFMSDKFKDLSHDTRAIIANFVNPRSKGFINIKVFEKELKNEMKSMTNIVYPTVETELENYKNMIIDEGITYTEFWESAKTLFPRLYIISKKYKCYSLTEVDIERLFSRCGNIITSKRNRLSYDKFSKLTCLQYNLLKSPPEEVNAFFSLLKSKLVEQMKCEL